MEPSKTRRSRDGCWTCRRRRKKCDAAKFPCINCTRLEIDCETDVRLIWEDDSRRSGMKRRGPPKPKARKPGVTEESCKTDINVGVRDEIPELPPNYTSSAYKCRDIGEPHGSSWAGSWPSYPPVQRKISDWPFDLDATECNLLDQYIQRFSRTYPTNSEPTNPFLRVFVPLSMRYRAVLDAVLALGGVQNWEDGVFLSEDKILKFREDALQACSGLAATLTTNEQFIGNVDAATPIDNTVVGSNSHDVNSGDIFCLLATSVLLMLYEKLTGEGTKAGSPHLNFLARMFPFHLVHRITHLCPSSTLKSPWGEEMQFLLHSFLYNDLVWSKSSRLPTLSDFYLRTETKRIEIPATKTQQRETSNIADRFVYPNLITRMSIGDDTVTDADIASWDGTLHWFPSFSLTSSCELQEHLSIPVDKPAWVYDHHYHEISNFLGPLAWSDRVITAELYRVTAAIYRRRCSVRWKSYHVQGMADEVSQENCSELELGNLVSWAIQLLEHLPNGSPFENAILWPIGIVAAELLAHDIEARCSITGRLQRMEQRFKMRIFHHVRLSLEASWAMRDRGLVYENDGDALFG